MIAEVPRRAGVLYSVEPRPKGDSMELEQSTQTTNTRRGFLQSAAEVGVGIGAASAGMTAASFGGILGLGPAVAHAEDGGAILDLAATAETLAVTFYYTALTGATFRMDERALAHLKLTMDAGLHHLEILRSLGGRSLREQFYLPERLLADASVFVATSLTIESALADAYVAATHQFAALGQPALAATAAQLGASAAQHQTLIGQLAGLTPVGQTLPAAGFRRVSDATPVLAPFLAGGSGVEGPVRFPSTRQYRAALGNVKAERVQPFVQVHGASAAGRAED